MPMLKTSSKTLRGGRMVKSAKGIVSFAPMMAGAVMLIGGVSTAEAQAVACATSSLNEMCDVGLHTGSVQTLLLSISADGTVASGISGSGAGNRALRWTAAGGFEDLGTLRGDDSGPAQAERISGNGHVVVGLAETDSGQYRAFRWKDDQMTDLGTLRSDGQGTSHAIGVSYDGSVVVGQASTDNTLFRASRAFRWEEGGGMTDLGTLRAGNAGISIASGVSADGVFVVGRTATNDIRSYRAFLWEEGNGMTDLGTLRSDGLGVSHAFDLSANGDVVVGMSESDDPGSRAFRWTAVGGMQALETLRTIAPTDSTQAIAYAVTADGSVIVGQDVNDFNEQRAVRWSDTYGMEDLGTLTSDNRGNSTAYDISDDGRTIVGAAQADDGRTHAFIYRTTMQDLANAALSLGAIVEDNAIAVAAQQDTVGALIGEGFLVGAGRNGFSISGNLLSTGSDNGEGIGSGIARSGLLSYGYGVSDQVTLGATIGIFGNSLGTDAIDADNGYGASLWAEFSQGGLDRTGWQGSAALAWGQQDATITRGLGFTNVTRATGDIDLDTRVVHASLGFGVQSGTWLLTPSVGLTHFRTERSGYAEAGSDTLASYDKLTMDRTTLTLALEGETRVSEVGRLSLGAGIEHDLSADRARVSGTSDVPGLAAFGFNSGIDRNDTRGFVSVGYRHDINANSVVSFDLDVGQAQLGSGVQTGMRVGYQMRF